MLLHAEYCKQNNIVIGIIYFYFEKLINARFAYCFV